MAYVVKDAPKEKNRYVVCLHCRRTISYVDSELEEGWYGSRLDPKSYKYIMCPGGTGMGSAFECGKKIIILEPWWKFW